MLKAINQWTSQKIIEPEKVTFVSKTAFSVDGNLVEFKGQKNIGYGEFEI